MNVAQNRTCSTYKDLSKAGNGTEANAVADIGACSRTCAIIATMMLSLRTSAIFLVILQLVAESDAVWKPKGNMHAHESPEYLFRQ